MYIYMCIYICIYIYTHIYSYISVHDIIANKCYKLSAVKNLK